MTIEIQSAKADGFTMEYFQFGNGAKTLVILPGLSVQSVMGFADVIAQAYQPLCEDFTVYVFDRRKEIPDAYSVHEMAMDTAAIFRALELTQINLFGVSQGGMIALEIAAVCPERIEKMVIGSACACVTEELDCAVNEWTRLAKSGNAEDLYLSFGKAVYPQDTFERSRALLIEAAKCVTETDLKRFAILAEGIKDYDVTQDMEKIRCPVLVIGNKDDRVLGPGAAETICRNHTRFSLYKYDGYGHASYDTAPDYKTLILDYLSEDTNE